MIFKKENVKMNNFVKPGFEIVLFDNVDIVTTSSPKYDQGGFDNEVVKP